MISKKARLHSKIQAVFEHVSKSQKHDFISYLYLLAAQSPGFAQVDLSLEVHVALDDFMQRAQISEKMSLLQRQKKLNTYFVQNPLPQILRNLIDELKPPAVEGMVFSVEEWARTFFEESENRFFVAYNPGTDLSNASV